ncbi:MAG: hypothetical protein IK132_15010 [Clostridia bacterium]|nr:hypothetical protein [Clostridia bacterium]
MKKALALLLAALMIAPTLLACSNNPASGDKDPASASNVPAAVTAEPVDEENMTDYERRQLIPDNLPETTFNGRTFRVLTTADGYDGRIIKKDEIVVDDLNGDACNDAVYNRNVLIEDRFAVKIECDTDPDPQSYINTVVTAGSDDYQLVGFYNYLAATPISAHSLLNWREVPNIDLSQPWHNQLMNDNCTIYGKLYAICSDLAITSMTYTYAYFFNLPLLEDYGYQSSALYDKVKAGEWTIDYFIELITPMYQDKNGDGKKDANDIYGFGYQLTNPTDVWLSAFDQPMAQASDEGIVITFMTDKTVAIMEKMIMLHYQNPGFHKYQNQYDEETYFLNAKLVFAPLRFYTAYNVLRTMEDPYSILPWPKWDENQAKYYTNADDKFTAFGLPLTVYGDIDFASIIYEALCAESYKKVYPMYYDTALKGKYSSEPETAEMVDIIMEGRAFDLAFEFSGALNDLPYLFRKQLDANNINIASAYKKIEKALTKNAPKQINKMYGD